MVLQQIAGNKRTFYGFVVKTGIDACGSRCQVYGRCRVWRDVERVGGARGSSGVRLEPVWGVRDRLTTQEFNRWPGETVTSSQSVLLPGELGSCRQSVRLGVRLPCRLLT